MSPATQNIDLAEQLEDVEAPDGAVEKKAPDYDPRKLPKGHPARDALDKGKVLFRSHHLGLTVPMDQPRDKVENGHRLRLNGAGHVIRFQDGEFWADNEGKTTVYLRGGIKKEMTEAEFLRKLSEKEPALQIREVSLDEQSEAGIKQSAEDSKLRKLYEMEAGEVRALFEPEEIKSLGLEKAPKDKLIVEALLRGKVVAQGETQTSS